MLSVYSCHYPPCTSDDINYKRCRCSKWINGMLGSDGPFIRRSANTRSWEKAEEVEREPHRGASQFNEPGIIVVFEVSPDKIMRDALGLGSDLGKLERERRLKIVFTTREYCARNCSRQTVFYSKKRPGLALAEFSSTEWVGWWVATAGIGRSLRGHDAAIAHEQIVDIMSASELIDDRG